MTTATDMLASYLQAEADLLLGKETQLADGRRLKFEDLDKVRAGRAEWERRVRAESSASSGEPTIGGRRFIQFDLSGDR